jgi:hypothetical protein
MTTLNTPSQIQTARLLTLRQMLMLEIHGLSKSKGPSAYSTLQLLGYKGTRQKVLEQLNKWREEQLDEPEL